MAYIILKHIHIRNANAFNGIAVGFPAITAWAGTVHNLQRIINEKITKPFVINSFSVSCHHYEYQAYRNTRYDNYELSIPRLTCKSNGEARSIIPQMHIHLDASIALNVDTESNNIDITKIIKETLLYMRIAGGTVDYVKDVIFFADNIDEYDNVDIKVLRALMPGYVLVESELLKDNNIPGDVLDRLLNILSVDRDIYKREYNGWLVPNIVGFKKIVDVHNSTCINARDMNTPNVFVEPVIKLCEFKMPIRFDNMDSILWEYHYEDNLYFCSIDVSKD